MTAQHRFLHTWTTHGCCSCHFLEGREVLRRPVRKVCSPEYPSDTHTACMCWEVILEDLDTNPSRSSWAGAEHVPQMVKGDCA